MHTKQKEVDKYLYRQGIRRPQIEPRRGQHGVNNMDDAIGGGLVCRQDEPSMVQHDAAILRGERDGRGHIY